MKPTLNMRCVVPDMVPHHTYDDEDGGYVHPCDDD